LVDITIWTDKADKAKQLIQQLHGNFEHQHKQWHASNKGSSLAKINQQLQQGQTAVVDPDIYLLLKIAISYSIQSDGLFNPAIGQLVNLWHFDQFDQNSLTEKIDSIKPPEKHQIQALTSLQPSMSDLLFTEQAANKKISQQLNSTNPAVKLDFGAFAKGYAVDQAIKHIRQAGFHHALINAGGDIKAIGKKGDKFWTIGIRNPLYQQQPENPVIASIKLGDNESIMTSGDYERYFSYQGKQYHHIIDPRTGYPAQSFRSVTILHSDAALADAAATAIFIAGPNKWKKIARKMGVEQIMIMTKSGQLIITKQLYPRLSLRNQKSQTSVVSLDEKQI